MTVSYTREVSSSGAFGCFLKLLLRWRGSIYRLVWADLIVYVTIYYVLNLTYRFALNKQEQWYFEKVVEYCSKYGSLIPLSFVLGFYVNIVMTRWWSQFTTIPYPDNLALLVSAAVRGVDERSRMIRRTVVRYVCLCFAITLTLISPKVKKRFPTLDHLVEAGLLMKDEKKIMDELREDFPTYPQFWLPLAWASSIITRARHEGLIRADVSVSGILQEINGFRTRCGTLVDYDWISVPLVYTQVVTIAVYTYFITSVLGRQYTHSNEDFDFYVPVLAILEFFFYMGWLRVAETLINPFGEDDDDFDVVWMIDRHVQVTYLIVDKMHEEHPQLVQDLYWDSLAPQQLPFTVASEKYIYDCPETSTAHLNITSVDAKILPPGVRRRTKENLDSSDIRTPSLIRRIFSSNARRDDHSMFMKNAYPLTSVDTDKFPEVDDTMQLLPPINQVPEPSFKNKNNPQSSSDANLHDEGEVIDFEKLKQLRQLITKQRVVKYMELMRQDTVDENEKKIDDILTPEGKLPRI